MKKTFLDTNRFVRPGVLKMDSYVPVLPPEALSEKMGIPAERIIKLDANENPYGPSPKVQQALAQFCNYHIYPDPNHTRLRALLEKYVGVDKEQIIAGAGSDELIDLIMRVFLEPGDKVINCVPTFGMYTFLTDVCGGEVISVKRTGDFAVDIPAVLAAIDDRTKLIFIASPNNPTGNLISFEDVQKLLDTGRIVIVDEAYYEFARATVLPLVQEYNNLIVLRTFSKWAGLAGLRVGYGIVPKSIIEHLWKIKQPYNVNIAAEIAACESLSDFNNIKQTIDAIIAERNNLHAALSNLDFLRPLPSSANFIYCAVTRGEAKQIVDELMKDGITIRYYDTPLLKNAIRISVGKPEHTETLITSLKSIGESLEKSI